MKKFLVIGMIALTFLNIAKADEKKYKCLSVGTYGREIEDVEITLQKGLFGKITGASASYKKDTYAGKESVSIEFRGPVKIPKETTVNTDAYLNGASNSRVNPFGNFDYLRFTNKKETVKFDDLSDKMQLSLYSFYGAVTNRMSRSYELDCESQK